MSWSVLPNIWPPAHSLTRLVCCTQTKAQSMPKWSLWRPCSHTAEPLSQEAQPEPLPQALFEVRHGCTCHTYCMLCTGAQQLVRGSAMLVYSTALMFALRPAESLAQVIHLLRDAMAISWQSPQVDLVLTYKLAGGPWAGLGGVWHGLPARAAGGGTRAPWAPNCGICLGISSLPCLSLAALSNSSSF